MNLAGRRIHIAGSADGEVSPDRLRYAHELVDQLVRTLASRGATFAAGIGKEPRARYDPTAPAIHFDWTVINAAADCRDLQRAAAKVSGRLFSTIATGKTEQQIPPERWPLWRAMIDADDVELTYAPDGWYSAAYRRRELAQRCDVAILLSGGEGVEHLATEYAAQGKPLIPLDLDLGASTHDGSGGAAALAGRMRAAPDQFFRLRDPDAAGALLARMSTRNGTAHPSEVVQAILDLLDALVPPTAFFVRLLNPQVEQFAAVDRFFANVVAPAVRDAGFEPRVMGTTTNDDVWMNEQIFNWLAESRLVVVDYTALRPSCFIELGYALRGHSNVLVTAQQGTAKVFDIDALEQYHWADVSTDEVIRREFEEYWRRNLRRPAIARPRSVL